MINTIIEYLTNVKDICRVEIRVDMMELMFMKDDDVYVFVLLLLLFFELLLLKSHNDNDALIHDY